MSTPPSRGKRLYFRFHFACPLRTNLVSSSVEEPRQARSVVAKKNATKPQFKSYTHHFRIRFDFRRGRAGETPAILVYNSERLVYHAACKVEHRP